MRTCVRWLGLVAAFAGLEHGIGEIRQGGAAPDALVIESWPDSAAFEPLVGEPALTVLPSYVVSGAATVLVSVGLAWWSWRATPGRRDGLVLLAITGLLLLVGGGFGPPLLGLALSATLLRASAEPPVRRWRRALARRWQALLALTVASFLALVPGVVVLSWLARVEAVWLPALLPPLAFTGLVLTLLAALADDRLRLRAG